MGSKFAEVHSTNTNEVPFSNQALQNTVVYPPEGQYPTAVQFPPSNRDDLNIIGCRGQVFPTVVRRMTKTLK